jgi:hypothetical protein
MCPIIAERIHCSPPFKAPPPINLITLNFNLNQIIWNKILNGKAIFPPLEDSQYLGAKLPSGNLQANQQRNITGSCSRVIARARLKETGSTGFCSLKLFVKQGLQTADCLLAD